MQTVLRQLFRIKKVAVKHALNTADKKKTYVQNENLFKSHVLKEIYVSAVHVTKNEGRRGMSFRCSNFPKKKMKTLKLRFCMI